MHEKKFAKNKLKKSGPKLSLVVTQTLPQAIQDMNYLPLFCVFYVTGNHELILKQVGKMRKHFSFTIKSSWWRQPNALGKSVTRSFLFF